jgi:hypothetical protein
MRLIFSIAALLVIGCQDYQAPQSTPQPKPQDLPITLGGFIEGHSESEKVSAACGIKSARETLFCDFYNGLPGWRLTEMTVVIVWSPYGDDDKRYFKIPVSIKPFMSEHQDIRLGLQLPRDAHHWGWQIVGAAGYHI